MRLSAKLPPVIDKFMSSRLTAPETQGKPKKLLDQVRDVLRFKHYSLRTERTYCDWIARFIRFHGKRHPSEMGAQEVGQFLTHLAREGKVAASTQNQALSALLFDSFAPRLSRPLGLPV